MTDNPKTSTPAPVPGELWRAGMAEAQRLADERKAAAEREFEAMKELIRSAGL